MLQVEIDQDCVSSFRVNAGTSKASGRPYRMVSQDAWVFKPGSQYPTKMSIPLHPDSMAAYPAGKYELDLLSYLAAGEFGRPILDTRHGFELNPVSVAAKPLFAKA